MRFVTVTALLAVLGTACGGAAVRPRSTTPGSAVFVFPDKASFPQPSAEPITLPPQLASIDVSSWRIETNPPPPGARYPLETYWDRLLIEALTDARSGSLSPEQAARLNPSLRCAATEAARFYVETEGYSSESLKNAIVLRCGYTFTNIDGAIWHATVPDAVPEGRVESEATQGARQLVSTATASSDRDVGLGYARGKGRVALVVYTAKRPAKLLDFSPLVQGIGATLNIELAATADVVLALANQGRLGVKTCERDPALVAPRYRFFCPFAGDETSMRVDVLVRREKSVLYESVAQVLFRRDDEAGRVYEPLLFGADTLAHDAAAFREALYAALNDARGTAGVASLGVEVRQAAWNDRVTPSFYRASLSNDPKRGEQAALVMLAGWDVDGTIRDAGFFAGLLPNERRPARWLSVALESPLGRWVLLDRTASRVAIGTAALERPGIAALVTMYSLFGSNDHRADEANIMALVTAKRASLGRARPTFRPPSKELRAALARIEREGISAYSALTDLVAEFNERGEPVNGFACETINLRSLDGAGEVFGPETLDVELGVTHYKPKGAAWGQYAALFLVRPSQSTR